MAAVTNSGEDVIQRKLDKTYTKTAKESIDHKYEIVECIDWITKHSFKKVALQFPDYLLCDAPAVATRLQSGTTDVSVFILGDTSYGSCCVDEVGAQHHAASAIIHLGHACLSPTARLPVLYVFARNVIDTEDCAAKIAQGCQDQGKVLLFYDTSYNYAIDSISKHLAASSNPPVLARLVVPSGANVTESEGHDPDSHTESLSDSCEQSVKLCGREFKLPPDTHIEDYTAVYIGDSNCATLITLMMTLNQCTFYTYNPSTLTYQQETLKINRALMKRFYLIERLKDANIIGVVAGTLGVARYKDAMTRVKMLAKRAGKKSYTFVVGKLNPAKLANFAEVDVYVLVACPESSLMDLSDFYRPIVTPMEVEFAFNTSREWTGVYSADWGDLLSGGHMHREPPSSPDEPPPEGDVSLISNRVRSLGVRAAPELAEEPGGELVVRGDFAVAVAEDAGEFLANRSWQGLERKLGETPVIKAVEGISGIAAGYSHEPGT